ncbi:hypothetical protein THRCLA_22015 [Thraustotheca clavata]|uniref:Uncharacterized protein n=1 Tax=Thraustotheca clavata TaxID=74557 RepID=A0A1V9ZE51_9STRA|nr:hypothetical protein THRCLA_22015 [Thraustotheca clavata]
MGWESIVIGVIVALCTLACLYKAFTINVAKVEGLEILYSSKPKFIFLFVFRILVVILYIATLVGRFNYQPAKAAVMYTVWNFILQLIYLIWALKLQCSDFTSLNIPMEFTKERKWLTVLFAVCFSTSFLVAVVYWSVIFKGSTWWVGYVEHGANNIVLIIDFILNESLVAFHHAPFVGLWPCFYTIVIWIFRATWLTYWPYTFMDQSKPISPLMYIAVIVAHAICFGFVILLSKAKIKWFSTHCLVAQTLPTVQERLV